ncbi:MAG: hypothetical protein OEY14_15270 [Myxococcales bacterium]|nr:hypothetical protein [Myxococcales bacterium]
MPYRFTFRLLLLSLPLIGACAPQRLVPSRAGAPEPGLCEFQGPFRGRLRASQGGYEFAHIWSGVAQTRFERGERLRLLMEGESGGWHLRGWVDPAIDEPLHARVPVWMDPDAELRRMTSNGAFDAQGVLLPPGASVQVLGAQQGEVWIAPSRLAFPEEDGYHFAAAPRRAIACGALTLEFHPHDGESEARDRAAFGFPIETPVAFAAAGLELVLHLRQGAEPFLRVRPEHPLRVDVLESTSNGWSRILLRRWSGELIEAWARSEQLSEDPGGAGGLGGLRGRLAQPRPLRICAAAERLTLMTASEPHLPEASGWIDPGTRFVVLGHESDGRLRIAAPPGAGLQPATDVLWSVRPAGPLECQVVVHDPAAGLAARVPAATASFSARVTRATGLGGVSAGTSCELLVEHHPDDAELRCRAVISCGEHTLFGDRPTNGYFQCTFEAGDAPIVQGADEETSREGTDPAMRIDTGAGTLSIFDEAEGRLGAFELDATLESLPDSGAPPDAP